METVLSILFSIQALFVLACVCMSAMTARLPAAQQEASARSQLGIMRMVGFSYFAVPVVLMLGAITNRI